MNEAVKIIHHGDEAHVVYIARVSSNQDNTDPGLLNYLIRQNHWSPFEMIGACIEINTTRDIGRQILRHRSFSFQEFSQRYAVVDGKEHESIHRDMRMKGSSNRQGSLLQRDNTAEELVQKLGCDVREFYEELVHNGVAPECARAILPEGLTPTKMYMHGTLRSWIHYLKERTKCDGVGNPYAQREHYHIAKDIEALLRDVFPVTFKALDTLLYLES